MDAYEATKVVFSRIQALDPDNAANIMGILLIQDHGEKEMIRLAFGPEALLHSVVLKARKDLGLLPPCSAPAGFPRQNSVPSTPLLYSGLPSPASSWPAPGPVFSRSNSGIDGDQLSSCGASCLSYDIAGIDSSGASYNDDSFGDSSHDLPDLSNPSSLSSSPSGNGDGTAFFPYGAGINWLPHYRRSSFMADDIYYSSEANWRPCLYYARGYCKNGSTCRFQHAGLADDCPIDIKPDTEELFLRTSNSQRLMSPTQLVASAAPFPYGAASVPSPTSAGKSVNFLLQQQSESQRAAAAAAAAALMLGGDAAVDVNKFIGGRSPRLVDRADYGSNPGSRQIYLTFPADSTFTEEDVSSYFSIYGPVHDVRIPYQQKRMFGFVTFVYPETVKLILAKGNPHFVCDARVLVKPYKEKGKVPDKKHQYQHQSDRADFFGFSSPTGLDATDPYDFRQLGSRMLFNASPAASLRRKMGEQQQAVELQQAIELQGRRFMGLQLLDLKKGLPLHASVTAQALRIPSNGNPTATAAVPAADPEEPASPEEKCTSPSVTGGADQLPAAVDSAACGPVSAAVADKEEADAASAKWSPNKDSDFQESEAEHNLPDSPFASGADSHPLSDETAGLLKGASHLTAASPSFFPQSPALDMASRKSSCFLELPRAPVSRFSSGRGAVGM